MNDLSYDLASCFHFKEIGRRKRETESNGASVLWRRGLDYDPKLADPE